MIIKKMDPKDKDMNLCVLNIALQRRGVSLSFLLLLHCCDAAFGGVIRFERWFNQVSELNTTFNAALVKLGGLDPLALTEQLQGWQPHH